MDVDISGYARTSETVSMAVVDAIASVEDVATTDLDFRLGDYVDPEAIDALATNRDSRWKVEFEVAGNQVEVSYDGTIAVENADGARHVDQFEPA